MKKYYFLALVFIIGACNQNQRANNQEEETQIVVGEQEGISNEEVQDMIVMIMINNRLKTSLALVAKEKSLNPKVAEFSQTIIDNHDIFQDKMYQISQAYEIEPPSGLTPEAQEKLDELTGLSNEEFQREYLTTIINNHEESLERLEELLLETGHPIETTLLQDVENTLQQQVEIAKNLQDDIVAGN